MIKKNTPSEVFTSSQQSATVTNAGQTTFAVTGVYCYIINFFKDIPQNMHLEIRGKIDFVSIKVVAVVVYHTTNSS